MSRSQGTGLGRITAADKRDLCEVSIFSKFSPFSRERRRRRRWEGVGSMEDRFIGPCSTPRRSYVPFGRDAEAKGNKLHTVQRLRLVRFTLRRPRGTFPFAPCSPSRGSSPPIATASSTHPWFAYRLFLFVRVFFPLLSTDVASSGRKARPIRPCY